MAERAAAGSPLRRTAPLLAVRDLQAWYGESHILHGVDFDVARGRGGDAARPQRRRQDDDAASRSWASWRGARARSRFDGARDRSACRRTASRGSGIALCPEERGIFASLNVEENLMLPPEVRAGRPDASSRSTSCFRTCRSGCTSQGTKLSGGEQQMLAIGRILRTGARLLLLDEPTEGLAPVIVQQIGRTIARAEGARASRSCWSSRTSASPRPSPTGTTSWSTAGSST